MQDAYDAEVVSGRTILHDGWFDRLSERPQNIMVALAVSYESSQPEADEDIYNLCEQIVYCHGDWKSFEIILIETILLVLEIAKLL